MRSYILLFLFLIIYNVESLAQNSKVDSVSSHIVRTGEKLTIYGENIHHILICDFTDSFKLSPISIDTSFKNSFRDTGYNFSIPLQLKPKVYQLYIFYRDSLKSQDSNFRLVRFYNLPLDSLGFTGWGFIANGMANFPNSLTHIVQIAASDHHVIYLNTAGKVIGQGYNYNNVLYIPANLDSVVDISSRFYHNLALLSNGKVVAWGSGTDTIISNPNYLQSIVPDSVEHIVQIAAGGFHSLALDKNGNIFAWGAGSTKTNNLDSLAYGQSIVPTNKKFTKISAGLYHSVAIRSDSIISVWGAGDSLKYITNNYQQSIIDSNKNNKIIDISAGYFHTLVLRADSTCFSFGDNTVDQQLIPDSINKNIVQISAGGLHNSILKSDSSLFQWGYGIYNPKQYYAIYTLNSYIPFFFHGVPEFGQAIVPASLTHNVAYISSGGYTNIALNYLSIKTAVNSFGSISNSLQVKAHNNYTITYSPLLGFVFDYIVINGVKYYDSNSSYTFNNVTNNQQINAYFIPDSSCILYNLDKAIYRSKDTLRFKGFNVEKIEIRKHLFDSTPLILSYVEKKPLTGFDTLYKFTLPDSLNNQVFIVRGYNFRDTANRFYLFRIDDRSLDSFGLVGWGRNQEQQLIVPDSVFNVTQFECALFTNIALRRDGKCFVWSRNIYEELEIPAGAENIVSVSAGGYHFLALKNDGTVFIWGNNDRNQQNIPDSGNNNATLISTSRYTSIVQKINNSVFGWNKSGDSLDFNTYIGVLNISQPFNYTKILGGEYHYLAYDKDSFLYSWGINKTSYYNFNAAYNEAIIPASLKNAAGLAKVNGFDAALYNSMVIKPDSTVFIWGPNFNNVNSVPSNIRSIVKVSIGFSNPLALDKNGNIWNNWGDNSYNLQKQPKKLKYATDIGTGFYHDFVQNRIYIISEIDTGEISPFIFLKYGDTFKVTYSPPIGYKTDSVVINDNLLSNDSIKSYTFKRVKRYQYLRVTTQRIRDTIFTSAVNGSIVGNQYKFYGDTVLITYSPNIGYEIDSIFIDGIFVKDTTRDSVNSFTFYYLTASHTFRVVFKKIQFEVKTAINNGFITPTSDVDSNSNFTINYKAATGHYIDSVFINGIFKPELITDSSYVFRNILGDSNIRVHTKAFVYNIFTEIINGNITPDSITYYDSIFMVTYLPKVGYQIDSVFINNIYREELQNTLQYRFSKVLGDSSISIKTKRLQFRISTQIFNGQISPNTDLYYDSALLITFAANAGYQIDSVFVNNIYRAELTNFNQYLFNQVRGDSSIFIKTKRLQFRISTQIFNGQISPNTDVYYDSVSLITFAANTGYQIDSVFVNNIYRAELTNVNQYVFNQVRGDSSISIKTKRLQFRISTQIFNGQISPNTDVYYDSALLITYAANGGYQIDSVFVNNIYRAELTNFNQYLFNQIRGDSSISIKTKRLQFRISTQIFNGQISPNTDVYYDSALLITYNANAGYQIDSVFVNNIYRAELTNFNQYVFNQVRDDSSISIKTKRLQFRISTQIFNGQISPNTDVYYDSALLISYNANGGYQIDSVFVNYMYRAELTNINQYLFNQVRGDSSISIKTKRLQFRISTQIFNGQISPNTAIYYDSALLITFATNAGYQIDSVFVNNMYRAELTNTNQYLFNQVRGDSSISIKTKRLQFRISTQIFNGRINPNTDVYYDSAVLITFAANAGYQIDSVFVNNMYRAELTNFNQYLFNQVRGDSSIFIKTKRLQFRISTQIFNGQISPNTDVYYDSVSLITFAANTGYQIDSVFVNNIYRAELTNVNQYVFNQVRGDSSISIKTKRLQFRISTQIFNGQISPNTDVYYDSALLITYAANGGYQIDSVFVNNIYRAELTNFNQYLFNQIRGDSSISIKTKRLQFRISTQIFNGQISPNTDVYYDSALLITYNANAGYQIDSVFVNNIYRAELTNFNQYVFNQVRDDSSISIKTKRLQFRISTQIFNGQISPNTDVYYDSALLISYNANGGYQIDSVFVNYMYRAELTNINQYLFNQVRGDSSISIKTKRLQFRISTQIFNGQISPNTAIYYDSALLITFATNAGYQIDSVFVNNMYRAELTNTNQYLFNQVRGDSSISIKTKRLQFRISTQIFNGRINPNTDVYYDSAVLITFAANAGYQIDSVFVNNMYRAELTNINQYLFNQVRGDSSISIKTKRLQFRISTQIFNGQISPNTDIYYDSALLITYNANAGYQIDSVFVNNMYRAELTNFNQYVFNQVRDDSSISIKTKRLQFRISTQIFNGQISPNTDVYFDSALLITYAANGGYQIDSVFVNNMYRAELTNFNQYLFNQVRGDSSISIKTKRLQFRISTQIFNGQISPNTDVYYDSALLITYNANAGYQIDSVFVNNMYRAELTNINQYLFNQVRGDSSISIKTKRLQFKVTGSINFGEIQYPSNVYYDSNLIINFNVQVGYKIDSFIINDSLINLPLSTNFYLLERVKSNITIKIICSRKYFIVKTKINNGLVSPTKNVPIDSSTIVKFQPYYGYKVDSVFINNEYQPQYSNDINNSILILNIMKDYDINIKCIITKFYVITDVENGFISQNQEVEFGSKYRVSYSPKPNYKLKSIYINGELDTIATKDSIETYTFYNIESDVTIAVKYNPLYAHVVLRTNIDTITRIVSGKFDSLIYFKFPIYQGYKLEGLIVDNIFIYADTMTGYYILGQAEFIPVQLIYQYTFPEVIQNPNSAAQLHCVLNKDSLYIAANVNSGYKIIKVEWYKSNLKNYDSGKLIQTELFDSRQVINSVLIQGDTNTAAYYYALIYNNKNEITTSEFSGLQTIVSEPKVEIVSLERPPLFVIEGNSVILETQIYRHGSYYLRWSPGIYFDDSTISVVKLTPPIDSHYFKVELTDVSGCSAFDSILVITSSVKIDIEFSNLITINNDQINDRFIVKNLNYFPDNVVKLYDFLGNLVVEIKNYDGYSYGGEDYKFGGYLKTGAYNFSIQYKGVNGYEIKRGILNIINYQ